MALRAHLLHREEFWSEYDHQGSYQRLREKDFASTLAIVYDKVKAKPTKDDVKPQEECKSIGSDRPE